MKSIHNLVNWFQEQIPPVAMNTENKAEGYLLLTRRSGRLYAYEVAANTWPAALALLQHHHHLLEAEADGSLELFWPLPPNDLTYYLLADQLPVRSEMNSSPDSGWMARLVSFSTTVLALMPALQARWRKHQLEWKGVLALVVNEQRCLLELSPRDIRLVETSSTDEREVKLGPQVFTQLALGSRPIMWAAVQAGQSIPADLIPVLDVLIPCKQTWIAGSDYF